MLAMIMASIIPAGVCVMRNGRASARLRASAVALTISWLLILVFIVGLEGERWMLDSSLRFAVVGFTLCIAAVVPALTSREQFDRSVGLIFSSVLIAGLWLLLVTLH